MKEGWKRVKLGDYITDIAAGPFGSNLKVECFVPKGFPIVDGANLKGFKVTDNITKFVTEEKARSLHRSIAKRGDIIVTISGTIGQLSYVPDDSLFEEYLCSQRQFRASLDQSCVDVRYLTYYFHSAEGQSKILMFANQVGVPALAQPLKNFRQIEFDLPSLPTQRKIAAVLGALDDKIELNRKMNANLEAQAQALFKSWFVDFEPFGGKMPKKWTSKPLKEFLQLKRNSIASSEVCGRPYLPIDMIPIKSFTIVEYRPAEEAQSSLQEFDEDDIVVGAMRVYFHRVIPAPCAGVTRNTCFVLRPFDEDYLYFSLLLINEPSTIAYAQKTSKGTTMPYAIWDGGLGELETALPTQEIASRFNVLISPMIKKIKSNSRESRKLAELRDALLPKLMSGELEVA